MSPVEHGSPVVIIGDGPIGLLHLQLFKALTDARVAVVGKIPLRMDKARAMGADAVFEHGSRTERDMMEGFAGEGGTKIVIISTSNPEAFELATRIAGKSAKINLFAGMPRGQTLSLDPNWMHYNQISITGTFSSTPALLQTAAKFAQEKVVNLSRVVTHQYPLVDIEKAIEVTEKYNGLRAVINRF
jgi:L-iditol 2-dehydrogenase